LPQRQFRSGCSLIVADFQRALSEKTHLVVNITMSFRQEAEKSESHLESENLAAIYISPSLGRENVIARVIVECHCINCASV
jgi:hypothetical protein